MIEQPGALQSLYNYLRGVRDAAELSADFDSLLSPNEWRRRQEQISLDPRAAVLQEDEPLATHGMDSTASSGGAHGMLNRMLNPLGRLVGRKLGDSRPDYEPLSTLSGEPDQEGDMEMGAPERRVINTNKGKNAGLVSKPPLSIAGCGCEKSNCKCGPNCRCGEVVKPKRRVG